MNTMYNVLKGWEKVNQMCFHKKAITNDKITMISNEDVLGLGTIIHLHTWN